MLTNKIKNRILADVEKMLVTEGFPLRAAWDGNTCLVACLCARYGETYSRSIVADTYSIMHTDIYDLEAGFEYGRKPYINDVFYKLGAFIRENYVTEPY